MTSPTGKVQPVLTSSYEQFAAAKARGTDAAAGRVFDPSASPLRERAIFVLGAPRSGTTWLQQLLLVHPAIAGAGELHIFCEGLGAIFDNHEGEDPFSGLSAWVTRPELLSLLRAFVDGVMTTLRDATRPDATHVLDKTPNHVPYAARLAEVYPDAAFVQIIRDGRDSAASALDLWSFSSDYSEPRRVAERWRTAVLDCRRHLSGLRYVEVRYEDLLADTTGELARIYDVIGLPYDDEFLAASAGFGATPLNLRPSRSDVGARKWSDMPPDMEREIMLAAGDLLVELGYTDAQHLRDVVSHRSVKRRMLDVRASGLDVARRGAHAVAERRAQRDPRRRRRAAVRAAAQAVIDAVPKGAAAVARLLPADVVLDDGGVSLRGASDVAAAFVAGLDSAKLLRVDADESAAAVRWTGSSAGVEMVRFDVDAKGQVERLKVTRVAPESK